MDDGRVLVAGVLLTVLGVSVAKDSVGSEVRTTLSVSKEEALLEQLRGIFGGPDEPVDTEGLWEIARAIQVAYGLRSYTYERLRDEILPNTKAAGRILKIAKILSRPNWGSDEIGDVGNELFADAPDWTPPEEGSKVRTGLPTEFPPRKISEIARDIRRAWPKPNYAAAPYLQAMLEVDTMSDRFYEDDAKSLVLYFLSNATSFRGEDAKRLKAELKAALTRKAAKGSSAKPRRSYDVWISDVDKIVRKRTGFVAGGIGVQIHLEDLPNKKVAELKERWSVGDSPERAIERVFGTTALEIVGHLGPPWGGYRRKGSFVRTGLKGPHAPGRKGSVRRPEDLRQGDVIETMEELEGLPTGSQIFASDGSRGGNKITWTKQVGTGELWNATTLSGLSMTRRSKAFQNWKGDIALLRVGPLGSPAKPKKPSEQTARDLEKQARGLGIRLKMEGAKALTKYTKGPAMTFDEVKAAPDGTVIYVVYRDPSHRSAEQGAYVVKTIAGVGRSLDNLSSFAYELEDGPGEYTHLETWKGSDPYQHWDCEEARMWLFRAVPPKSGSSVRTGISMPPVGREIFGLTELDLLPAGSQVESATSSRAFLSIFRKAPTSSQKTFLWTKDEAGFWTRLSPSGNWVEDTMVEGWKKYLDGGDKLLLVRVGP